MTAAAWFLLSLTGLLKNAELDQCRSPSPSCLAAAGETAGADTSVEAGHQALDHRFRYPWYDRQQDDLQPIDVSPPWYDRWRLPETNLSPGTAGTSGISVIVWALLAVLAILLLAAAIWTFLHRGGAKDALDTKTPVVVGGAGWIEALPVAATIPQSAFLDVARRHYEAGRYREAIVYLFSYQLVELDKCQFVRLAKGKTNRQYLRELGARRPLRRLVEQTMVTFEDAFFGNRPIGKGRFEACWLRLAEFQALTAEGSP